nr:MAG TPA: hypothetical protein [Caudoviricetes sp.]
MVGDPIISAPYGLRHTVFNKRSKLYENIYI